MQGRLTKYKIGVLPEVEAVEQAEWRKDWTSRYGGSKYGNPSHPKFGVLSSESAGVISKPTPISQGVGNEKKGVGNGLTPWSKCPEQKHLFEFENQVRRGRF